MWRKNIHKTKRRPFSQYLLYSTILFILFVALAVTAVDYLHAKTNFEENAASLKAQTEHDLVLSTLMANAGFELFDESLNTQMKQGFSAFLNEYERAGRDPSRMNLQAIKETIGGTMDLYVINESGVIVDTTYAPEQGLDFKSVPYFFDYLTTIRLSEGFFPDRVVSELGTDILRKYAYMPTPDHHYVFELGLIRPEFQNHTYFYPNPEYVQKLVSLNPYISDVRIFDIEKHLLSNFTYVLDNSTNAILDQVIRERSNVILDDSSSNREITYLFIDLKDDRYGSDVSRIIELTYNPALIQQKLNELLFFHFIAAIAAIAISIGFAVLVSRALTTPIRAIADDVAIISKGDLDHKISPTISTEFGLIEQNINEMVGKLKQTIEHERISEERFRSIMDASPDIVWEIDKQGNFTYISSQSRVQLGYAPEDLIGKPIYSLIQPEFVPAVSTRFLAHDQEKQPFKTFDVPAKCRDGSPCILEIRSAVITGKDGQLTGFRGIARDITERKRAEEALLESETRYREFFTTSRDCVFITSPDGRIIEFNDATVEMFGYDNREEISKVSVPSLYAHSEDRTVFLNLIIRDGYVKEFPVQLKRKDGTVIDALITGVPLRNPDGTIKVIIGTARDITERRRAEEALRESEKKYKDLVGLLPQLVFEMDTRGTITFVNQYGFDTYGYSVEDFERGINAMDIVATEDRNRLQANIQKIFHGEVLMGTEYTLLKKDGTPVPVLAYSVPIVRDTTAVGLRGILVDIVKLKHVEEEIRKLNEELEQRVTMRTRELEIANRELESFTYTVSHDLRAPLRALDGYSSILLKESDGDLSEEGKRYLHQVRESAQKMSQLIDDLLNFSRAGKRSIQREMIDPSPLVQKVIDELEDQRKGRDVEIIIGGLPPVFADPSMLHQIFSNLLSNALKFTRKIEHVRIEIGSFQQEKDVVYYVRDNGVGFDLRYADKLFTVFQRFHSVREYEGSGIGLAIVKRIVERHGGRIWAESKVGKGSTFYFTLSLG